MKLQHIAFLILAAGSFAALGQPANPFLGKWYVTWEGDTRLRAADLVITESGGSWHTQASSKMNPCLGATAPISIESVSDKKIVVQLKYSEARVGCADHKVVLLRAEDGSVTGKRGKSELTVSRR